MNQVNQAARVRAIRQSLLAAAVLSTLAASAPASAALAGVTIRGTVGGTLFTPPVQATSPALSVASTTAASVFANAKVCIDTNDNGVCDAGEASTLSKADGSFLLAARAGGPLIAEISTASQNNGQPVTQRMVLRVAADQVANATFNPLIPATVAVTPLSTEVVRMMDEDGLSYQTASANLASRLDVTTDELLVAPTALPEGAAKHAVTTESVALSNRWAFAAKMVDRKDVSPAALALNPAATGPAVTMKEAQRAAMNVEGIPRYDHVFIIMLENKATSSIKNSVYAPRINAYLNEGNQFTSYYSTGNPSEPNRLAVVSGDDFGVTDDSAYNCYPSGTAATNAPEDTASSGTAACTSTTNHNHKNKQTLMSALNANGMQWRIYSESIYPGWDWRRDNQAHSEVKALDNVYTADEPTGAIGTAGLMVTYPSAAYAAKHNGSVFFQNVRSSADFLNSNRTLGGGQWDDALAAVADKPANWEMDQFAKDLESGDVGQFNILEPDQCDDMHAIAVTGTLAGASKTASDCSGNPAIYRGDKFTDKVIKKIQASPLWNNPNKRVAIVMMFDEGTATSGFNSCCGWNTSGMPLSRGPLVRNPDGSVSNQVIANYASGNRGHGTSIHGVLTNQPGAPKGVQDSDAYSHMSLVRTFQDMFQLADPADDWSYMNRSKYTENFVAANILNLPEYAGSADTHFDAVRPMNHAYVIPAGYVQKNGYPTILQVGPDADQRNGWALK